MTKVTERILAIIYTIIENGGKTMKSANVNEKLCVACGCCLTACKVGAISISNGVHAVIEKRKCIGCGMCARKCPASIITIKEGKYDE